MKKRGLVIGLLIMLALVTSGFTYAFWAGSITQAADVAGTVTIGQGGNTTVTVLAQDAVGILVPTSIDPANDEVTFTFDVEWTGTDAIAEGTLSVSVVEVFTTISATDYDWAPGTTPDEDLYGDMFRVTISVPASGIINVGDTVEVTVTLVFENEPASQAIYNQVATGELSIVLDFNVIYN